MIVGLDAARVLSLVAAGITVATSIAQPQEPTVTPKWEVASVRPCDPAPAVAGRRGGRLSVTPGRLHIACIPVMLLIKNAFVSYAKEIGGSVESVPPFGWPGESVPISGGPRWLDSDRYDIEAKAEGNPSAVTMYGPMLQALLEDRFKLKIHRETKEIPVYNLVVAKGGFKLQPMKDGSCRPIDELKRPDPGKAPAETLRGCGALRYLLPRGEKPAIVEYHGMTLDEVAGYLVTVVDRPVINKTGIGGMFDFHLEFAADGTIPKFARKVPDEPTGGVSIFTAIQQEVGLKLEPARGPGEFLVIDSVERPSEN